MSTRRNFIKSSILTLALNNPIIKTLSRYSVNENSEFSFDVHLFKEENLLNLHYYFYNLIPPNLIDVELTKRNEYISENGFILNRLVKENPSKPSFIVIKLPQQHIIEKVLSHEKFKDYYQDGYSIHSFISDFSILTYKVEFEKDIEFNLNSLLKLSDFKLQFKNYERPFEIISPNEYPLFRQEHFKNNIFLDKFSNNGIPLTLLELPYKIYLSPFTRDAESYIDKWKKEKMFIYIEKIERLENYDIDRKHKDDSSENDSITLQDINEKLIKRAINIITESEVFTLHSIEEKTKFYISGYAKDENNESSNYKRLIDGIKIDVDDGLLPTDACRRELAKPESKVKLAELSNLRLSSLGASAFIDYRDLNVIDCKTENTPSCSSLVGWKQNIKLGRDQLVRLDFLGRLVPFGHKVLYVEQAKRVIENGISYMQYQNFLEVLEPEKDYLTDINPELYRSTNFRKIKIISEKSDFIHSPKNNPYNDEKYKNCEITDFINGLNDITKAFWPRLEKKEENGIFKLLEFEFEGTDWNNQKTRFKAPFIFIKEDILCPENSSLRDTVLNDYEGKITEHPCGDVNIFKDNRKKRRTIAFNNQKIDFLAEKIEGNDSNSISNQETFTIEFVVNRNFKLLYDTNSNRYNIFPEVDTAKVKLNGIDDVLSSGYVDVKYSENYIINGISSEKNRAQIFLNLTDDSKSIIKDIFNKNLDTIGGIVNPDLNIESISAHYINDNVARFNSYTFSERMNNYSDFNVINPGDIFKGSRAKLFGTFDLTQLLQCIPVSEIPLLEYVNSTNEIIGEAKKRRDELKTEIAKLEMELKETADDAVYKVFLTIYNEYSDLQKQILRFERDEVYLKNLFYDNLSRLLLYLDSILIADEYSKLLESFYTQYKTIRDDIEKNITSIADIILLYRDGISSIDIDFSMNINGNTIQLIKINLNIADNSLKEKVKSILLDKKQNFELIINVLKVDYKLQLTEYIDTARDKINSFKQLITRGIVLTDAQTKEYKNLIQKYEEATFVKYLELKKELELYKNQDYLMQRFRSIDTNNINDIITSVEKLNSTYYNLINEAVVKYKSVYYTHYDLKNGLKDVEVYLENHELKKQINKLLLKVYGDYNLAKKEIENKIGQKKNKLNDLIKAGTNYSNKFRYSWETDKIKDLQLGPVKFHRDGKTKLSALAEYTVIFDASPQNISSNGNVLSNSYFIETKLENFSLSFLEIIYLDFNHVKYSKGTDRQTDFNVKIKKVNLTGILRYLSELQEHFSTLGDGFRIEELDSAIGLKYELAFPEIKSGGFNLFNLNLNFGFKLHLHERNDKPIEFIMSLGRADKKFGMSIGIWGGEGFFELGLTAEKITFLRVSLSYGLISRYSIGGKSCEGKVQLGITFEKIGEIIMITGFLEAEASCTLFSTPFGKIEIKAGIHLAIIYLNGKMSGQGFIYLNIRLFFVKARLEIPLFKGFKDNLSDGSEGAGGYSMLGSKNLLTEDRAFTKLPEFKKYEHYLKSYIL